LNQKVASRLLKNAGFYCEIAKDGEEAVELALSQPYDLILMDIGLPKMNGNDACKLIREKEKLIGRSPTPIVAQTAFALEKDINKCIESGMQDWMTKPIHKDILVAIVKKWVNM